MEALERRGRPLAIAAIIFIVFWSQCKGVTAQRNSTRMTYVCPPNFIRLGHSCYYFSDHEATWHNAMSYCIKNGTNLAVPARWEDRNLRTYLNKPNQDKNSRWIGGIYDYGAKSWRWGGELKKMHYQSFSKMKKMTPEELQWDCIAMIPELLYRWSPRKCMEPRRFICQTKLKKEEKNRVKELRKRWGRNGKLNEISAPIISREINDPNMLNDITSNPVPNPKSYDLRPVHHRLAGRRHGPRAKNTKAYDLRPNELKKRSRSGMRSRRLKRPFPGYSWNRRDPEGSYLRNAELLRSGRTGLTQQQINAHLARLRHLRDKQIARRNRIRDKDDWLENEPRQALAQAHPRTYTVDNNISALYPKTIVEEFDVFPQPVAPPRPNNG